KNLSLEEYLEPRRVARHRVLIPVSGVHRGTLEALNYARSRSSDVTAVHVSIDPEESQKLQQKWEKWGDNTRLVIVDSQYRLLLEPLLEYIQSLSETRQPGDIITVVVPQFVPEKSWTNVLHTQTALWLRFALLSTPGIVITEVPYQVKSA
ncbi:MAG: APC family permease, partial [Anaerolineales bacterium]